LYGKDIVGWLGTLTPAISILELVKAWRTAGDADSGIDSGAAVERDEREYARGSASEWFARLRTC